MKICVRKEILIGVLIGAVILGMIAFIAAGATEKNGGADYARTQGAKDGYKYTSHETIYINGNDDFVVGQNGVVSGNGTESNPYIIEGWDIDASTAHGIYIKNTDVYFIIRNCVVHDGKSNFEQGIYFYNVTYGTIDNVTSYNNYYGILVESSSNNNQITNCTVYNNSRHGIRLWYSSNNQISNCNVYNNYYGGIYLYWYSNNNQISNCTVYNHNNYGIVLGHSSNNQITDCAVYNNSGYYYGIYLYESSNNNNITNCAVYNNNGYGIYLDGYNGECNYNQITNSDVYTNSDDGIALWYHSNNNQISNCSVYNNSAGIRLRFSSNNQIINSTVYNNDYGIYLVYSSNNQIHYSNIYDNTDYGIYNYYSEVENVANATHIWWGSASGPYHPDTNPDGTGDNVTDNVIYDPWLEEPWEQVTGPVHNLDKDTYYQIIQAGVNDADPGNRIFVSAGTYYENVIINKTITLIGEDRNTTIIDGSGTGDVIYISADWVNVSGFGVRNSNDSFGSGIYIYYSSYINITGCIVSDNQYGIHLYYSLNCLITDSTALQNCKGIRIMYSSFCSIINCSAESSTGGEWYGIGFQLSSSDYNYLDDCVAQNNPTGFYLALSSYNTLTNCIGTMNDWSGIWLSSSSNNVVTNCKADSNSNYGFYISGNADSNIFNSCTATSSYWAGFLLDNANDNVITNCTISSNYYYGMYLYPSTNNKIHHNNFVANTYYQAYDVGTNYWDDEVSEGNYWSDYAGSDANNDWIGDGAYGIPGGSNKDNYPLMYPCPVGNPNKPKGYSSIQDAIDDATAGDTIYVWDGTYYENIVIDKTISLVGRDRNNTIIDGSGTGDVIYISADWVNVSGFGVRGSGWECHGIRLYYSSNNALTDCSIHDNYCGILCYASSNNNISNCHMWDNERVNLYIYGYDKQDFAHIIDTSNTIEGKTLYYLFDLHNLTLESINTAHVTLAWCSNVTLKNSNITNGDGIYLPYSSNNNILHCGISGNYMGVYLLGSSVNNITNCTVYSNFVGIYILTSGKNYLSHTACYNNSYGVLLTSSSKFNEITYCNISENDDGIYICSGSEYGLIHHNNFINNTINAYDECSNYWDYNGEGNYWSDYNGTDADNDGIGDTPYNISGGDNVDNYPLMHEVTWWDKEAPTISLISPDNNSVIQPGTVIGFEITDDNLWKASYCVDNGDTQPFSSDYNISTDGWSDGIYNIMVYAKDWGMNENTKIFAFTIDSIQPNISLISPDNNSVIKPGANLDFEINDIHLNLTTYTLNDGLPETLSSPYDINTWDWEDGTCNITIFANDLAGNEISKMFTFTIDGTLPTINIAGVTNDEYYNTNITPIINITDAHLNISETIITLDNSFFVSGTTVSSEGKHTLCVYAADTAGNNVSQTIIFTIDKTKPVITISDVEDGAYYNVDVVPVIDITDDNLNTTLTTLNGNPFTSGTTISAENTYALVVQADDKAGNNANKTITFIIDKIAPTVTITEPSQTTSKSSFTMSWSASDDIQYYEISTDGVNWVNVSTGTSHTFTLSKGANTLYVRGTDFAGNKGTGMITVTYQEKKQGKPGIIPGFEITIFLVVLGIIILLKRKNFVN